MPPYALPGTEVGPRRARIFGVCALVLAVCTGVGWRAWPEPASAGEIHVALVVNEVGAGVGPGTDVRLDGVRVGSVGAIDVAGRGRQRIMLSLTGSQLFGLTDAVTVDYAPGNLFGISALDLHSAPGGTVLADGMTVDLTGAADRVRDATLATLLKSTGKLTGAVLTPQLTELLRTAAHDLSAFTPLLQAIGATARAFAETQQLPPSLLFDRFGSALAGVPPMLTGGLAVLEASYVNKQLASPEQLARFGAMFSGIRTDLLPTATTLLGTSQRYFSGLLPIGTTILDQVSASISTPDHTASELTELLTRLGAAFHDTPDGPVLDAAVELTGVPGLATPLAAVLGSHPVTGGR
ncbi:mammalian cell entry protein [Nocardia sp. NPDC059239]|uniref:mammalian cell entry protein n=1 Tax=unclassified Nocardia TaxID=2637762 RepID=UPI0036C787B7